MSPILLIVEGADYASALSDYLQKFYKFRKVTYNGDISLRQHLDQNVFSMGASRVVMCGCHLTAVQQGQCTIREFIAIDGTFAALNAKLVLAIGKSDGAGILADAYSHSHMDKMVSAEAERVSPLLKWLGLKIPRADFETVKS